MVLTVLLVSAPLMVTATGVFELVVVPSPSWPQPLLPQQAAVPSDKSAHVLPDWNIRLPPWVILVTVLPVSAPRPNGIGIDEEYCAPQPKRQYEPQFERCPLLLVLATRYV